MSFFDVASIYLYVLLAALFVVASLIAGSLLRPRKPYDEKRSTYECGEDTIGTSFVQFNVRFYVIALIFLIFDVEVAALFPWTAVFQEGGLAALVEMLVFVAILLVGYAYVWVKGDLEWIRSLGQVGEEPKK